ncbi:hypothetical protein HPB50_028812 [Hyalomma asiaticum]|nr:hypothetical protein HPB50_028812 [Hyalomma asiaticum]
MDTVGTDDDEKETDNEHNATNGDSEWSIFSKRKPNRKVKPDQLRLERVSRPHFALSIRPLNKVHVHDIPKQSITAAIEMTALRWELAELVIFRYDLAANSIKVTVRDDEHAERLAALTRLAEKTCGRGHSYEVSIERTPAQKVGSSRGVIKVRPGQTIEYIIDHLRCETAKIIDARLLGKTNMLLLTFDTESPPTRLVFDYEITKVHVYRPKVIACYNSRGLGHIAKYCPSEEVCKEWGRKHSKESECDDALFCVACQKEGNISLNSACPSRVPKDMKKKSQHVQGYQRTVSCSAFLANEDDEDDVRSQLEPPSHAAARGARVVESQALRTTSKRLPVVNTASRAAIEETVPTALASKQGQRCRLLPPLLPLLQEPFLCERLPQQTTPEQAREHGSVSPSSAIGITNAKQIRGHQGNVSAQPKHFFGTSSRPLPTSSARNSTLESGKERHLVAREHGGINPASNRRMTNFQHSPGHRGNASDQPRNLSGPSAWRRPASSHQRRKLESRKQRLGLNKGILGRHLN